MKKLQLFIPLFVGICTITVYSVWATTNETIATTNSSEATSENYFPGCNDDDKVIQLEDGGFLGGQAFLQDGENTIYLDSETDENAITVKEAKQIIAQEQNKQSTSD